MSTDPRIDAYIANAAEFARPILNHLRTVIHEACPDVEEKMKWSFPHFDYKGMLCSMAAFKRHCVFGFWKGSMIIGKEGVNTDAMGQFGRITTIKDLPSKTTLKRFIKAGMRLNDEGVRAPSRPRAPRSSVQVDLPVELVAALKKNRKAMKTFEGFSPSHRREYVEWIAEAKREETRLRRVATTIEWLSDGKSRNWKYEKR